MDQTAVPLDFARMFLGDQPPLFLAEIAIRTLVIYGYTYLLLRWSGGRGIAQLSLVEFLLVIALGSAVGDAMFYPEVPLVHALLVVTLVVLINRVLDVAVANSSLAERLLIGRTVELVRDGVIRTDNLRRLHLGRNELFQAARESGIADLGAVRRAYLEASGRFSFFTESGGDPGLAVVPPWMVRPPRRALPGEARRQGEFYHCCACGAPDRGHHAALPEACGNCGHAEWAVTARNQSNQTRWQDARDR